MEGMFPGLRELHKKILESAPLDHDVKKYTALLTLPNSVQAVNIQDAAARCTENVSPTWCLRDITALQLCLIRMLITKADNPMTEHSTRCQYAEVLELLLQAGMGATIIHLFQTPDKVLSHFSSKCLSCLVLFQLRCQSELNVQWMQFCQKTLCDYSECQMLIPCLTSLLYVCKGILREQSLQRAASLVQLLGPLDPAFRGFCSSFLSPQSVTRYQHSEFSIHLSCLVDLLEVLVALRTKLKCNLPFGQHVLSMTLPQALSLITSPVSYFVKKKLILVLKRCLLCKAGEDIMCSLPSVSQLPEPSLECDMASLSGALLSTVRQGWLLQVPVSERSSSFGGATEPSESGPDLVILGAVSLSMLKALEVQHFRPYFSCDVSVELQTFMEHLLIFLKHHLGKRQLIHPCEWVSLTFIEQDDDMLELAKSLLKMYTQCHSLWFPTSSLCVFPEDENRAWHGLTHQTGCDPHCIFLLLLKSVAFDASVLLDFLISSETCFLEYLVRYLKILREDWLRFCLICTLFDKSVCHPTSTSEAPSNSSCQVQAHLVENPDSAVTNKYISITASTPATVTEDNPKQSALPHSSVSEGVCSLGALQRLVAYDSSEDSESECAEDQTPVIAERPEAENIDLDKQMGRLELRGSSPDLQSTTVHTKTIERVSLLRMQLKATRCLGELQEAICKLHRKHLFPYNPSALLRLLSLVGTLKGDMSTVKANNLRSGPTE